jgi:hypothetical protein
MCTSWCWLREPCKLDFQEPRVAQESSSYARQKVNHHGSHSYELALFSILGQDKSPAFTRPRSTAQKNLGSSKHCRTYCHVSTSHAPRCPEWSRALLELPQLHPERAKIYNKKMVNHLFTKIRFPKRLLHCLLPIKITKKNTNFYYFI